MKFEIRPAPPENIDSGAVWLSLPSHVPHRSNVKITNSTAHKSIYCEALAIDWNFVDRYNSRMKTSAPQRVLADVHYDARDCALPDSQGRSLLFISDHYRARLGDLTKFGEYDLGVSLAAPWWGQTWACLQHPQLSIRLATLLGLLGLGLGILSVLLGVLGVWLGFLVHK
jgi:hypothetical protein